MQLHEPSHICERKEKIALLLFFSFFLLLSLLLTVFDRIRQVNEKQRWKNNWQPSVQLAPARMYVPMSACLMSSGMPASQHDDETVRE